MRYPIFLELDAGGPMIRCMKPFRHRPGGAVPLSLVLAILGLHAFPSRAAALGSNDYRIRVSVKRVLSSSGARPTGGYGSTSSIAAAIDEANAALRASGASWELVLTEVVDTQAASSFYSMSASRIGNLEAAAKASPSTYLWRSGAINIYVVDEITDAGGVCSFPPNSETIVINSRGILGGGRGWLHEIGHYFNLIHTHESDRILDTIDDPDPPSPFNCSQHDQALRSSAAGQAATPSDLYNTLHNIMSYHCDPRVLTPLQVIRMQHALLAYRRQVLEAAPARRPPIAEIFLPLDAAAGRLPFSGPGMMLELDGSASFPGRGQTVLSFGGNPQMKHPTYYFRHAFEVADPSHYTALELRLRRDDGAVVYLNGVEVVRSNMPSGPINRNTLASSSISGAAETAFEIFAVAPGRLVAGRNVLAVEVHQASLSSSDVVFDLELKALPDGVLVPDGARWRYDDSGADRGTAWRAASYDDSGWPAGPAPLGYGDITGDFESGLTWSWSLLSGPSGGAQLVTPARGWERACTSIGFGDDDDVTVLTDMRNRYLALYLTRAFEIADPAAIRALELDITYDDGFAAYLNGEEVARRNLPAGAGPNTPALSSIEPTRAVIDLGLFIGVLLPGENRLSIQVHNASLGSSDLSMHPVLSAETAARGRHALIPSRAAWYIRKGIDGAPPPDWALPGFDPGASRLTVRFDQPGVYRFGMTVDNGLPPGNTAAAEVELAIGGGFVRGDCNGDARIDVSDALFSLLVLFAGRTASCLDACDANGDGRHDLTDALYLLSFIFRGGSQPPPPFPFFGEDPAGGSLGCGNEL
jgi:hypothetical protein